MSLNSIFDDCDEQQATKKTAGMIQQNEVQLFAVIAELGEQLTQAVNYNSTVLAKVINGLGANLKRRINANGKMLANPVDAIYNTLTAKVSENGAVLQQTAGQISTALQAAVQGTAAIGQGAAVPAVLSPVVATGQTEGDDSDQTQGQATEQAVATPQAINQPQETQAATGQGVSQATNPVQSAVNQILPLLGQLQSATDIPSQYSQVLEQLGSLIGGLNGYEEPVCPPAQTVTTPSQGTTTQQGGNLSITPTILPPVDLDQPLAFKFAPDDSPWIQQATAFYGPFLSDWLAAPMPESLTQTRESAFNPQPLQPDPQYNIS
jgi:hypothetical protein